MMSFVLPRLRSVFASALLLAALAPPRAFAGDASRAEAAQHWARGQRLAADGDREGALLEYREAFELVPSPAVLWEIARQHAALGEPIAAKRALDRLLLAPGELSRPKIAAALQLQAEQARRIARARLVSDRAATFTVDARPVGGDATSKPELVVELDPGRHVVTATAEGCAPVVRVVELPAGAIEEVFLELPPAAGIHAGSLVVRAGLPGADVLVDGHVVGVTPLAGPVPVAPGDHEVVLSRPGYRASPRTVTIRERQPSAIELEADLDSAAAASSTGEIVVRATEPEVTITLNGVPRGSYKDALLVPAGPHRLRVERKGFEPIERTVDVPAGGQAVVVASLDPTPSTRDALAREAHARRRWGWAAIGAGAVTSAALTTFIVLNEGKINDAQRQLDAVDANERRGSGRSCDPMLATIDAAACARVRATAEDRVVRFEFRRVISAAGLAIGIGAVGMGLVNVLTGPAPDQYDRPNEPLPMARARRPRLTFAPLLDLAGRTAGAAVGARF